MDPVATRRWRRTSTLAAGVVAAGAVLVWLTLDLAPTLAGGTVLGLPLGDFLLAVAAPAGLILLAGVAAHWQRRIDTAFGVADDD